MSRRKRLDPPLLVLTREPGLTIAGRDADGEAWIGVDLTKLNLPCALCRGVVKYGYAPTRWNALTSEVHCVSCVEFRDVEQEPGR